MSFVKKFRIYARNITPKRIGNYLKVKDSLRNKAEKVSGKPLSLFIEPTNICNLKCPLCPTGNGLLKKNKGYMSLENYKKIIDKLGATAFSVTLWNYGEPSLNKDFFEMIKYAKKKGLKVITSTNGILFRNKENISKLVDSGLDELVFAVDGATEETYSMYRKNGNFNVLIEGIKELVRLKKEKNSYFPFLSMQFIIMKDNEHEVEEIQKLAKELGPNELILKTVFLFNDASKAEKYLPKNKEYSRYIDTEKCKDSLIPGCDGLWTGININYDGAVVVCCFDYAENFKLGNIFEDDFENEIWNSEQMQKFRKMVWENKNSVLMCKNCPTNTKSQDYKRIIF
jgi:radical SAM protein with 4Fe4S-binding SPASM domain